MGDFHGEVSGSPYLAQRKAIGVSMLPPEGFVVGRTDVSLCHININKYLEIWWKMVEFGNSWISSKNVSVSVDDK